MANLPPANLPNYFRKSLKTVDLIFRNGIDWRAFTYSFNQVIVENEDLELSIQSIENKGDGVVVVRVNVPPDANKANLHTLNLIKTMRAALKALEAKHQAELRAAELKARDDQTDNLS